jgi:predicted transcriptional regulator
MQLKKYLDLVQDARLLLIETYNPHPLFRISGKGRDFLKAYKDLKALMN